MSRLLRLSGARHLLIRLPGVAVPAAGLTPAERAVVEAALAGKPNAEIAAERATRTRTIANQLSSAYRKLGVRSRGELARKLSAPSGNASPVLAELSSGAWTLVERIDAGDRRWVIARPRATPLSGDEVAALRSRARGASLSVIARELGVSEPTASRRVQRGMQKLGVTSVAELARVLAECA